MLIKLVIDTLKDWFYWAAVMLDLHPWIWSVVVLPIWGVFKMIFPFIWPVKLLIKSNMSVTLWPIDGIHSEPWILFGVEVKIKSRVTDTIDDFYLELRLKSKEKIKLTVPVMEDKKLERGYMLRKHQSVGPFEVHYEINQSRLGISGIVNAKKVLNDVNPFIILKTGVRCKWSISKRILFAFQESKRGYNNGTT